MKALILAIALVLSITSIGFSNDICTVPTANQLKTGQVDIGYYYIDLDFEAPMPSFLYMQAIGIGITDTLELDIHRYDPQKSTDKTATVVNASLLVLPESVKQPQVVLGGRNITGEKTTNNPTVDSEDKSWYVCAAKTVTPGGNIPVLRLHAGYGTEDNTLLGETRHEGFFGGMQAALTAELELMGFYDGQDIITGICYTPNNKGLTLKGGTFGDHWWTGLSYNKAM